MRVLVYGDSIGQGFWDEQGGWVQRLRTFYDTKQMQDFAVDQPTIFNLSINGDTAEKVLVRFEPETKARLRPPMAAIFAIGLNDSLIEGNNPWTTPESYGQALRELIGKARLYFSAALFVGLTTCDEPRTTPVAWGDYTYTNDRIWQFETVLRQVCQEHKIPHVPIFESFQGREKELLLDGLHPNDQGHKLLAMLIKPGLEKLLGT